MGTRKYVNLNVRGTIYPTAQAAAAALGVSVNVVQGAARNGRLETLGIGGISKPVIIRGVSYPSCTAAGRALGVSPNTVAAARRKGTLHRVGTGAVGVEPLPVRIRGVEYPNVRAAAAALKCPVGTVYSAICQGNPDRLGVKSPGGRHCLDKSKPVTIGPLTFPSMRRASIALGFSNEEYVSHVINSGSRRGWQTLVGAAMHLAAERDAIARRAAIRRQEFG